MDMNKTVISTFNAIELPIGNYRVVFLANVGAVAAFFREQPFTQTEHLVCEYRFGRLKWRLVNGKDYANISRIARLEEYKQLSQTLEQAGYKITSVLSCQLRVE